MLNNRNVEKENGRKFLLSVALTHVCVRVAVAVFYGRFANMRLFVDKCLNNRFFSLCIFSKIKFSSLFVQKNIHSGEIKFSSE